MRFSKTAHIQPSTSPRGMLVASHRGTCADATRRDGRAAGHQEGRELGLQKGFEIAQEIGFYSGDIPQSFCHAHSDVTRLHMQRQASVIVAGLTVAGAQTACTYE